MAQAHIVGVGQTAFGRHDGADSLDLMARAAAAALADAGVALQDVDGLLCGYATTTPHLMLSDLFAERLAMQPHYAHGVQLGGATGGAMLMLASDLIRAGRCRTILVVAGENRLSGQTRDQSIQTLSTVGDRRFEVPNGTSVPAYYALLASAYVERTGLDEEALAELAVLMRHHAAAHPDAHLREPITVAEVMASKPIATPLKLLDCCPISDGGAAIVVSAERRGPPAIRIAGAGQAHLHQHLTAMSDPLATGAALAASRAFAQAGIGACDIDYLALYDSFTITLAMLLEEIGFAPRGQSGHMARAGVFGREGALPLNLHGGLLSFGHSGVAGGMAHVVEAVRQMRREAGDRQVPGPIDRAFVHADGGVMSAHVAMVLERAT